MKPLPFIDVIVGARPNYIKAAALLHAEREAAARNRLPFRFRMVTTGQHHLAAMSGDLARQLGLPEAEVALQATGTSPSLLTASILQNYDAVLRERPPRAVLVVGDVTSTLACALAAKQHQLPLFHVEAGLRSADRTLPEELNRIAVDHLSDLLFTTTDGAAGNLLSEGVPQHRIHTVGNTVIDTLLRHLPQAKEVSPSFMEAQGLRPGGYWLLTLHRPSNVDDTTNLLRTLQAIAAAAAGLPVVFPIHPRTLQRMQGAPLPPCIVQVPPQGYLEFIHLLHHCRGVLTDSGGVSEEAAVLSKPCLVLRPNTERPETVHQGTAVLADPQGAELAGLLEKIHIGSWHAGTAIPRWDGGTGPRILEHLQTWLQQKQV